MCLESNERSPPLDDLKPMASPNGQWLNREELPLSENWASFSDTSMTLEKFISTSSRYDSQRWAAAYKKDAEKCKEGWARFIGQKNGLHVVPSTIDCDRTFLRDRTDAAYLEAAVKYLRGISTIYPIQVEPVWYYPGVGQLERRIRARNWAVGAAEASRYHNRLIAPSDWAAFSCRNIQGRFKCPSPDNPSMLIKSVMFPWMPNCYHALNPACHLGVEMARMAYYFGQTVRYCEPIVRERYEKMVKLESKINVVVAFMQESERGRIWDIRREQQQFLKSMVRSLPRIRTPGEYDKADYFGDLDSVLTNMDLWDKYEKLMDESTKRFQRGNNIRTGKLLEHCGITLCFDSNRPKPSVSDGDAGIVGITEEITITPTPALPTGRLPPTNNAKRPRMATNAHGRIQPSRNCKKSKK